MQRVASESQRDERHPAAVFGAVGVCVVVLAAVAYLVWPTPPSLAVEAKVVEVGIGTDGTWFVRLEVSNKGSVDWQTVAVANPKLSGPAPTAVKVGSAMPHSPIPATFELIIQGESEGVIPKASALSFDLAVITSPSGRAVPASAYWPLTVSL